MKKSRITALAISILTASSAVLSTGCSINNSREGKTVVKEIYVPNKIVNIVVK